MPMSNSLAREGLSKLASHQWGKPGFPFPSEQAKVLCSLDGSQLLWCRWGVGAEVVPLAAGKTGHLRVDGPFAVLYVCVTSYFFIAHFFYWLFSKSNYILRILMILCY